MKLDRARRPVDIEVGVFNAGTIAATGVTVRVDGLPADTLDRFDSLDGRWRRVGSYAETANGLYAYTFEGGSWQGGFYRLRKQNPFILVVR